MDSSGLSRSVVSSQTGPHFQLKNSLAKHRDTAYRKPIADHNRRAFDNFLHSWETWKGQVRLDTGCGVGESTARLAQKYPEDLILGVDKSQHRLETHQRSLFERSAPNYLLIRADLEDFWRLCRTAGLKFKAQYFLYPNPWPRKEQYLKRWPAHPLFPLVLELSDVVELRTNWEIYAQEFAVAVEFFTGKVLPVEGWNPSTGSEDTPFERKYASSGQVLWRVAGSIR